MSGPDNTLSGASMWDARYAEAGLAFGAEPNAFLASQVTRLRPGSRVLVPGDGDGRNGVWLAEQGLDVETLDLSPVGVAKALEFAAERNVRIRAHVADLATWAWPEGAYDAVVSIFLHLPPELRRDVHAKFALALKPGGFVIIEGFGPAQMTLSSGGPRRLEMLFTPDMLQADFGPLLTAVSLEEVEAELAEGPRHRGPAALVRGLFRRTLAPAPESRS